MYALQTAKILLPALAFLCVPASGELFGVDNPAGTTEENTKAVLFKELDSRIQQLEELQDSVAGREEKTKAKQRMGALKERRRELREQYSQAGYEELKRDVNAEYERLSFSTKQEADKAEGRVKDYIEAPSAENKSEAKAALATLDTQIDNIKQRTEKMSPGVERDAVKRRIQVLEDRRRELNRDFRKARYEALKADVESEWKALSP